MPVQGCNSALPRWRSVHSSDALERLGRHPQWWVLRFFMLRLIIYVCCFEILLQGVFSNVVSHFKLHQRFFKKWVEIF